MINVYKRGGGNCACVCNVVFCFDLIHVRTYREHEFCLNEYGGKSHGGKMLRMKVGLIHTVPILFQVFCLLDNSFIQITSCA